MSYEEIKLEKWSDFVGKVSDQKLPYRNWAFRGQEDSSWSLSSSLYRYLSEYLPNSGDWERREEHSLRAFKRRARLLLERVPDDDQIFEWWGLMQHHGAPTRLLDFTFSPYVAAFFALEKATKTAAVWALNPKAMKNITASKNLPVGKRSDTTLYYGEPFVLSKRLIAQQGTFVITKTLEKPIDEIIDNPKNVLAKFLLPAGKIRSEGMKSLYKMNIKQATLFPGLDGLAHSMAYELEFRWFE